jgi:His-Xaa-Ser system protein HxsD
MTDEKKEAKTISVDFDSRVFSLIAVKKAAYKYIDCFSADIGLTNDEVRCLLKLTSPRSDESFVSLIDDFKKEVLDQDLREKLKVETEPVRNLILAHAFSKTGIISHEPVSGD